MRLAEPFGLASRAISRHSPGGQGRLPLANAFAAWDVTKEATLRLNVDNLFNKKYIGGLSDGAIYGEPRTVAMSLEYQR